VETIRVGGECVCVCREREKNICKWSFLLYEREALNNKSCVEYGEASRVYGTEN